MTLKIDTPPTLEDHLCFGLYATSMAITRAYKPMLDDLGITYPQYLVLTILWEADGQSITAIAKRMGLEPSTITPLVKRLEAARFVTRRRDKNDERIVSVRLTDDGRELRSRAVCLARRLLDLVDRPIAELMEVTARVHDFRARIVAACD